MNAVNYMKILFAASEMTPYAKTGGLGDVVGALAGELSRRGHEVTCCVPFYRSAREVAGGAKPIGLTLRIRLGSFTVTGEVVELKQRDGVRVWFVRCDEFFDRAELYYDGVRDYADNAERFLFFSKAVVELMGAGGVGAEVVHCHDWQTAFVPVAARAAGFGVKTVLTIHNLAYQGIFPAEDFALTNLGGEMFRPAAALEFYGWMNLLKGGIVFADTITTVSRRYAEEILTAAEGCGLDPVLATRAEDLHGIVNGVDYARWNPATDPHLRQRYGAGELAGKGVCRADLVARVGLVNRLDSAKISETQLVAGFVSRLTEQKGVEVLAGALEGLVGLGVRVLVLGRGERKYEEVLTNVAARFPGRVVVKIAHDEPLAHQIQGGGGPAVDAVALRALRIDAIVRSQIRDDTGGARHRGAGRYDQAVQPALRGGNWFQICFVYVGGAGEGGAPGDFAPQTAEEMAEVDAPRDGVRFFVAGQRERI